MRTIFVHIFILPCIYSALAQALTSGVENVGLAEKRIKAFDAPATAALLVVLLLLLLLLQQHPFPAGPISIVIISTIYSPNWQGCEHWKWWRCFQVWTEIFSFISKWHFLCTWTKSVVNIFPSTNVLSQLISSLLSVSSNCFPPTNVPVFLTSGKTTFPVKRSTDCTPVNYISPGKPHTLHCMLYWSTSIQPGTVRSSQLRKKHCSAVKLGMQSAVSFDGVCICARVCATNSATLLWRVCWYVGR